MTALIGVLGGIVQQVQEDLSEARRVRLQRDRLWRHRDRQLVAPLLDQWPAGFDGAAHHRHQVQPLLAEFDLAPADAGNVEQIVHQPGHLPHLAVDHVPGPLQLRHGWALGTQDLHGIGDGGQRIA